MDLRELRFFLAVAREKSFVRAAEVLHHTQPNITRTIKALEDELGSPLFNRSAKGVQLTPKGKALLRRATEITDLVEQTQRELTRSAEAIGITGDVYLAAGETIHMEKIASVISKVQNKHPGIHFHIHSANGEEIARRIDLGLADLGLVFEPFNLTPYAHRRLPWEETWGILVPNEHPLAIKDGITPADLRHERLIVSSQMWHNRVFEDWYGIGVDTLDVVASYNLVSTARQIMEAGLGIVLTFDGVVRTPNNLRFVPLKPALHAMPYLIRKRSVTLSPPVGVFLDALNHLFKEVPC